MRRMFFSWIALSFLPMACIGAEVIVTPIPVVSVPNPGPTFNDPLAANTWLRSNVRSGSSIGIDGTYPRSGTGSAFMSGIGGVSKADMQYFPAGGFGTLGNLSSLSYEWYRDGLSTNPPAQAPALRLQIDIDGNPNTPVDLGYLIYEPTYNGAGPSVPTDSWQSSGNLNLTTGNFWWFQSGVGADDSNPNSFTRTIQDYFNPANINAPFALLSTNSLIVGINFGFGSGWNGVFQGAVDNVAIGLGGNEATRWNFELTQEVPEPSTIAVWSVFGLASAVGAIRRRWITRVS